MVEWDGWDWISPGGVRYRAPYGAKNYINQLAQAIFKTTKMPQICKLEEIRDCNPVKYSIWPVMGRREKRLGARERLHWRHSKMKMRLEICALIDVSAQSGGTDT